MSWRERYVTCLVSVRTGYEVRFTSATSTTSGIAGYRRRFGLTSWRWVEKLRSGWRRLWELMDESRDMA